MLRKLSVRGKILAALAVPVLVLGLAATLFSFQGFSVARVASQAKGVVSLLPEQRAAVEAIAAERDLAVWISAGNPADSEFQDAQAATDKAIADLTKRLEGLDTSALDSSVQSAIDTALAENATDLSFVRSSALTTVMIPFEVAMKYTAMTNRLLAIPSALSATLTDRGLAMELDAYVATLHALDQVRLEAPVVQLTLDKIEAGTANENLGELPTLIEAVDGARTTAATQVAALADPNLTVPDAMFDYLILHRHLAANEASGVNMAIAEDWGDLNRTEIETLAPIVSTLEGRAVAAADAETSSRQSTALYTLAAAVLTLLASVGIALFISRRITVPLRNLTAAAADVRDQLPQLVEQVSVPGQGPEISLKMIAVESSDEVGQLAAAFNDVNHTTVEVAKEQAALRGSIAEMFVNVARRDHVLLNRQLAFLDELERSEEDSTTLANLFRLDHLATRMRRNSESLLVLAGIDSGRRVRHNMPISDVVRTASSEIELYDRIRLNLVADPLMLGHNALTAAHLLAELLENATVFSEPNTPVEVTTTRTARTINVEVRDYGLGMTAQEINEANIKIASRSASDVIGIRQLGLFVVGRLSERLGAQVVFSGTADGSPGTVVTVSLPAALFVNDADIPLAAPTDPLALAEHPFAGDQPWTLPEPELEDAYPVDLAALTDGETNVGMPRRRTSAFPSEQAPEAGFESTPEVPFAPPAVVLPELASADLSVALADPDELGWSPPVTAAAALPSRLPSRSRFEPPAEVQLPPTPDAAPVDEEKRSAMFSSFRTLGSVDKRDDLADATDSLGDTASLPQVPIDSGIEDLPSFGVPGPAADAASATDEGLPTYQPLPTYEALPTYEPLPTHDPGLADSLPTYAPADADSLPTYAPADADSLPTYAPADAYQPTAAFEDLPTIGRRTTDDGLDQQTSAFEEPQMFQPEPVFPAFSGDLSFGQEDGLGASAYQPVQAFEPLAATGRPQPTEPAVPLSDSLLSELSSAAPQVFEALPTYEPPAPFDPLTAFEPATPFSDLDPEVMEFVAFADRRSSNDLPEEAFSPRASANDLPAPTLSNHAGSTEERPEAAPWTSLAPAVAAQPAAGPSEAAFEPTLPSFADVVGDAPTRRSVREKPAAKRGLFGRKKRQQADSDPAQPPVPVNAFPTFTRSAAPAASVTEPAVAAGSIAHLGVGADPGLPADDISALRSDVAEQKVSAWMPSAPVPVVETLWEPEQRAYDEAQVPLRDLPSSRLDAGAAWTPVPVAEPTVSSVLAMRSAIQEQALAELSELSAYRPAAVETSESGGLQRRTRAQVAESTDDLASQRVSRDAAELRSRLSAFQSATSRGRQVPSAPSEGYGGAAHLSDSADYPDVPDSAAKPR